MRLHRKLVATALAGLLLLGVTACEVDPGALDEFEEPGIDDGLEDDDF